MREETRNAIEALGHSLDEYTLFIEREGYTLVEKPDMAYLFRTVFDTYYEGHCLWGGAKCIDHLIEQASLNGLTPLTSVDTSSHKPVYHWLIRKRGFSVLAKDGHNVALIINKDKQND